MAGENAMTELDQLEDALNRDDLQQAYDIAWVILQNCDYRHDSIQRRMAQTVIQNELKRRTQDAHDAARGVTT